MSRQRVEELHDRLSVMADDLADVATDLLRSALDTSEDHERVELANLEKRVTKARRAVEKARGVLAG
jgi:hypothetical protein